MLNSKRTLWFIFALIVAPVATLVIAVVAHVIGNWHC
jgi:hypothetical protein